MAQNVDVLPLKNNSLELLQAFRSELFVVDDQLFHDVRLFYDDKVILFSF